MLTKIHIPGSKSHANRALILSALSNNKITLTNLVNCDDTHYMIEGLKLLGYNIQLNSNTLEIEPTSNKSESEISIYTGNAGTTTRFLTALATLKNQEITIDGNKRMRQRPISILTNALNSIGAKINDTKGCPPLKISAKTPEGGQLILPGNISSQYISALLMIAPYLEKGMTLKIKDELCSKPYIHLTIEIMKSFGLKVQSHNMQEFVVSPQSKIQTPANHNIESDASSASYFGAIAALHPEKPIQLRNITENSLQGDITFLNYLKKMGCKIKKDDTNTTIQGPQKLKSLGKIDMNATPDLVMTFAVLAMFTDGITEITNISNLRIKETDRIQALKNEIEKFGIKVETGPDFLKIHGTPDKLDFQKKITIKTYDDHRIAMCFGILKDLFPHLKIQNKDCVNKSYQTFWQHLNKVFTPNIALIGLRGSGKSTLGQLLAKELSMDFVDLDSAIEKRENKNISTIVKEKGWEYFRKIETEVTEKATLSTNQIIATGGGTILSPTNLKNLQNTSHIIYLHTLPETCADRIKNCNNRPPLTKKNTILEELNELYQNRDPLYRQAADVIFDSKEDLENAINKLLKILI